MHWGCSAYSPRSFLLISPTVWWFSQSRWVNIWGQTLCKCSLICLQYFVYTFKFVTYTKFVSHKSIILLSHCKSRIHDLQHSCSHLHGYLVTVTNTFHICSFKIITTNSAKFHHKKLCWLLPGLFTFHDNPQQFENYVIIKWRHHH